MANSGPGVVVSNTPAVPVRQLQPDDAAWRQMRFMVFDLPAHPGVFDARLQAYQAMVARLNRTWVVAVPQQRVESHEALQRQLKSVVRAGAEGLMLHRGDSLYRAVRGEDLVKLKPLDDAEARVLAHLPGKGKHAGRLGALEVETPEGLRFRLGSGFTDAQREHPPAVGAWVTYPLPGAARQRPATLRHLPAGTPGLQAAKTEPARAERAVCWRFRCWPPAEGGRRSGP